jgi:hypothetical protein
VTGLAAFHQFSAKVSVRSHMFLFGEYCRRMGWSCGRDRRPRAEIFAGGVCAVGGSEGPSVASQSRCMPSICVRSGQIDRTCGRKGDLMSRPRLQHDRTRSDRSGAAADEPHSHADHTVLTRTSAGSNRDRMAAAAAFGDSPRRLPLKRAPSLSDVCLVGLSLMRFGHSLPSRKASCLDGRLSRTSN